MCVGWVGARALACACARLALITQHATSRHIAIRDLSGSTYFLTLSHKLTDFGTKVAEYKMFFFYFLYNMCLKYFSF